VRGAAGGGPAPAAPAPAPATTLPRKDAAPLVDAAFRKQLAFCHEPGYALTPDEHRWCALMPQRADPRCPRLREACGRKATAAPASRSEDASTLELPGLGSAATLAFWLVLGFGVAYLLAQLVRRRIAFGAPATVAGRERSAGAGPEPQAATPRAVETDVERLLQQARAAAAAGDFRAAIDAVYGALLRKLEGSGVIAVEPHQTNGDHVREVGRKQPALRAPLQQLVAEVENVQFGGAEPDEAAFRAIHDGALGLMAGRLGQLVPVVLVAGIALAVAVAGCSLDRGRADESPSGRAAVRAFLQQYGFEARDRLTPLAKIDTSVRQLVLLPGAAVDQGDWAALARWLDDDDTTLIVAGGTRELPDWIDAEIAPAAARFSGMVRLASDQADRFAPAHGQLPPSPEVRRRAHRRAGHEDATPSHPLLTRDGTWYAAEQPFDEARVVVLADDALFTNQSLLVDGNAQLLGELLRAGGRHVELVGDLTGLVSPSPLASVRRGQLAPALLQLAIVALLFFACRGALFGRALDPPATARRGFAEHVRALGIQYARAGASRRAVEVYGGYAVERLRERLRLSGDRSLHGVAEAVAARTGRPVTEVMRLLVYAHPDAEGTNPARPAVFAAEDLATLREIATLLNATGGAGARNRGRGEA
jgi:hypothetical protein